MPSQQVQYHKGGWTPWIQVCLLPMDAAIPLHTLPKEHHELQCSGTSSPNALDSMAPKEVPVQRWVYLSARNAVQKAPLKSREWGKQPGKEARK